MNRIALINFTQKEYRELSAQLKNNNYQVARATTAKSMKSVLEKGSVLAAMFDIDEIPKVKDLIQIVAKQAPETKIFCLSVKKLHPDLEDLISRCVYACLAKPIETSELFYLLDGVKKDRQNSRGNGL